MAVAVAVSYMLQVIWNIWLVTQETWHMTRKNWHLTHNYIYIFFLNFLILSNWCYYPHTLSDSVSPICKISFKLKKRLSLKIQKGLRRRISSGSAYLTAFTRIKAIAPRGAYFFQRINLYHFHGGSRTFVFIQARLNPAPANRNIWEFLRLDNNKGLFSLCGCKTRWFYQRYMLPRELRP